MSEERKTCFCSKILQIILLVAILACSAVSAYYSYNTNMIITGGAQARVSKESITKAYAKDNTIEKAKESGKPTIVLFYADWCGYCQKFAPTFYDIVKARKIKSKLSIAYVNGALEENQKYISEYGITGFPTVYMVDFKTGEKEKLSNSLFFNSDTKKVLTKMFLDFAKNRQISQKLINKL